ncbi:MAG: amidohydrolase family protein [Trueperaceae bacterium]
MDRPADGLLDPLVTDRTPQGDAHGPLDLAVHGDLVLPGGEIVRDGWLGVRDGRIASIGAEPLPAHDTVDARGRWVLPGAIDAHVHARSNPDEGLPATTTGAAAGGTTTVIDMPFDAPDAPVRDAATLRAKIDDVAREAVVDVALWATFAPDGGLDAIAPLAEAGACGFKASTIGVDPVRFPRIPDHQLLWACQEIAATGRPFAAHQENQEIVEATTARLRAQASRDGIQHARSRHQIAETEAAARLLEIARAAGARLHMVHGTVARTFELIHQHRTSGTQASGETCLHYLAMDENDLSRMGARAKCNPPLRARSEVDALWAGLADGAIDIVTSDHSPYPEARKSGDLFDAAAGMPGVETLLTMLHSEGVATGRIDVSRFTELLCERPADLFGLTRKGRLAIGRDADFVIFDGSVTRTLEASELAHPIGWSPFEGREVAGRVEATWLRGQRVFDRAAGFVGAPGSGAFVRPD